MRMFAETCFLDNIDYLHVFVIYVYGSVEMILSMNVHWS